MSKLKIFGHPWHLAHQYELTKFPFADFYWLVQDKRGYNHMPRGDFFKGKWVSCYEKGKYDLAILHLDQQMLDDGIWEYGKASLYRQLNDIITDIPKVVIMHGTPYEMEMTANSQDFIDKFKAVIGDNHVVYNSHKAKEQWQVDGTVIWHGLNPKEWWDLPKEPRVVTMIGPAGLPTYYDRPFLSGVKERLAERDIRLCHITIDYQAKTWDEYRNFLGKSLVYFNPTRESPMPRARTEAMLSGCCVVTTPHQDADMFIKNGVNGFLVDRDIEKTASLIERLIYDYPNTLKIGQEGKKTAIKEFSVKRYQKEWYNLINKIIL